MPYLLAFLQQGLAKARTHGAVVRLLHCLKVATDFGSLAVEVGTMVQVSFSAAEETMEQTAIFFPVLGNLENYLLLL